MEQRKCFSLQRLSPLPWSTLRTRKNSIAKEKHLALGVSCFVPAPRAWRQLRNLIKINGEKELNKSQHEYLWKSILQRSGMEVKKEALFSLSLWEAGRLKLSQSALDLSLSVYLSHSLSLSLSLSLPPSSLQAGRGERDLQEVKGMGGRHSPKRSLGPSTIIECKTHGIGPPATTLQSHYAQAPFCKRR